MRNKKQIKEAIASLKDELSNKMSSLNLPVSIETTNAKNDAIKSVSDVKEENKNIIKKTMKSNSSNKLVGNNKMKLPIGKLYSIGKDESKESTGAVSAGGYSQPLFSETKKEMEEKWSKKYKDSIDCDNPKGFSQRAHCQGKKKNVSEEKLKGGKSDEMTLRDIAKKHDKKSYHNINNMMETLKKELSKGIKVEMEHTNNRQKAKEIAMDHLYENPKYYSKLKKIETKEATSSSSVGIYDAPGFEDVKMKGNHPKGSGRTHKKPLIPGGKFISENTKKEIEDMTDDEIFDLRDSEYLKLKDVINSVKTEGQYDTMMNYWSLFQKKFDGFIPKRLKDKIESKIKNRKEFLNKDRKEIDEIKKSRIQVPGGKFVQVKEKCKKFPYCNQGDIKALKIFENEKLKEVISKISKEKQISESLIKKILISKINKSVSKK